MAHIRDLYNNVKVTQTLDPATATATATGATVDASGFGSVLHLVNVGESGDTLSGSVYWTITLQESADDSTWTDAAAADVQGTQDTVIDAAAEDDVVVELGYTGTKRYSRTVATKTGTHTNGTPIGMTAIQAGAEQLPVVKS